MTSFIKFYMVEMRNRVDMDVYLDTLIDTIVSEGIITLIGSGIIDEDMPDVNGDPIVKAYFYEVKMHSSPISVFTLCFAVETYDRSNRLSVELVSDNYNLSILQTRSCLESLKVSLSRKLIKDFSNCVWLHDMESQMYATDLYPRIHEAENLIRQFINEVMINLHGVDWWNIVPQSIKSKLGKAPRAGESDTTKQKEYKSVAPSLQHIDDKLMLLEIGDLKKIIELKKRKLTSVASEKVNDIINGYESLNENTIGTLIGELKKASTVEFDLWANCFSLYLSEDFLSDFNKFDSNRNHVAHNKLLDFQAYSAIKDSVIKIREAMIQALIKFRTSNLSEEEAIARKKLQEQQEHMQDEHMISIIEEETNLTLHDKSSICELFEEKYYEFYNDIEGAFGLRMDLDISLFSDIVHSENEFEVFSIRHKVKDQTIQFFCTLDVTEGWGSTSTMTMTLKHKEELRSHQIEFVNGDFEYNESQSYHMPTMDETFNDEAYDHAITDFTDYIEEHFEDLMEAADMHSYSSVKDGGEPVVTEDVCCSECDEYAICLGEDIAKYGQCLRCGEMNDICVCAKCSCYFEGVPSDDGEPDFCENCVASFAAE